MSNKQLCMLNSRIEHQVLHNDIDEEVKTFVDDDVKHHAYHQSLLDDIRRFNMKIENSMNEK